MSLFSPLADAQSLISSFKVNFSLKFGCKSKTQAFTFLVSELIEVKVAKHDHEGSEILA